jgi:hypothetical protein
VHDENAEITYVNFRNEVLGDLRHSTSNDELDAIEAFMWLIRTALPVMMRRALETSARVWGTGSSSTGFGLDQV